jgi:probable HAF family extracellular repeat protein
MRRPFGSLTTILVVLATVGVGAMTANASARVDGTNPAGSSPAARDGQALIETLGMAAGPGSDSSAEALRSTRTTPEPPGAFIYRTGRYTALDSVAGLPTAHLGTNNRGQIVGATVDGATLRGFLRDERGDDTSFDAAPDAYGTLPFDINDRGTVAGAYADAQLGVHGFLRRPNGAVTTVDIPGAQSTIASGINDRGAVVGNFVDGEGRGHGFLLDRGTVITIDPPDANPANANNDPLDANVWAFDVNDRGQIVGFYPDANGTFHGFLYDEGHFTRIDPPDASDSGRTGALDGKGFAATAAFGIDNGGRVVGQYLDADGMLHGYLRKRKRGFRTIDPPRGAGTVAVDINDRGQILLPASGSFAKGDGGF